MLTFKQFLKEVELNVTVDTDDPVSSLNKTKETLRKGKANPAIAIKKRQQEIKTGAQAAKVSGNKDEQQVKQEEDRVARLKMNLLRKREQQTSI